MSADQFLIHCMDCEPCRQFALVVIDNQPLPEQGEPCQLCEVGVTLLRDEMQPKDDNAQIQITE